MNDELYRDVTSLARRTPDWLHTLAEYGTDAGLLLLAALFAAAWWAAPRRAPVVAGAAGTAGAYGLSELLKVWVERERPCRAVHGAAAPLADCPPPGDWSFPSNHATIAGAAAVALAVAWPRIAGWVLPFAVVLAASRVFVGVHYPLDVAAGLALGAAVAAPCAALARVRIGGAGSRRRRGADTLTGARSPIE
ncbi:PA-phosphatase-like phosphoesterase [Streptomyces sp. CNQ-509]|uniref:phosphatase PAP2 family protein n=1 Tax=unclassified Streptomyces TaxID=2593676 RepID=UPI00062DE171|nr:phosphatase PAP2 family protein [Streptomyces sp. CNQ-509]AKH83763.1 PA-phosphatase-like phosphoesterase [Streptomyces sp. CNQ-509]